MKNLVPVLNTNGLIIGSDNDFVLSAKESYDPSNAPGHISYSWLCVNIQTGGNCVTKSGKLISSSEPEIGFTKFNSLLPGEYNFSLVISKDSRLTTTRIPISVLNGTLPLTLVFPSKSLSTKLDPTKPVVIKSYTTSQKSVDVKWECIADNDGFEYLNLDTLFMDDPYGTTNRWTLTAPRLRQTSLIIPEKDSLPNWFGLFGESEYRFSLQAQTLDDNDLGLNDIVIKTNSAPSRGYLEVFSY